jgi:hypothetical protein
VLENVAVHDAVERRVLERQVVSLDVCDDDLVEQRSRLLGGVRIQLDTGDTRDTERLQRCTQPACRAADVEQCPGPRRHERLDVWPLVDGELTARSGGGPLRHEARLVM